MEVLVTGGDTDLGRTIAESYPRCGPPRRDHRRPPRRPRGRGQGTRRRRDRVRQHRPGESGRGPRTCSRIISTPSSTCPPRAGTSGDPRTYTPGRPRHGVAQRARRHDAVDRADRPDPRRPSALGRFDHQRRPREPARGQRRRRDQGGACRIGPQGQATHFGTRGITVNAVASGRSAQEGYAGLGSSAPVAAEIARLALFLSTPAARHITGQTMHVSNGALANFG